MDISKRARSLRLMIEKEAAQLSFPKPPPIPKPKDLNKPPVLTSPSQPAIDLAETDIPALPKMRITGIKPKFHSPMKSANPYNKQ